MKYDEPAVVTTSRRHPIDPQAAAAVSVCWLIALNKPFYPLYVYWIAGHGLLEAYITSLSAPLFVALAMIAQRRPDFARIGLPILGALDTALAVKLFGAASGAELFYAPCALLAALLTRTCERRTAIALAIGLGALVLGLNGRYGAPIYVWSDGELTRLFTINLISVVGLTTFMLLRFSRTPRL